MLFPRDWVASKVAVHEDCDLVNMFLSSKSQRRFGLSQPDIALHVTMGQSRIHEAPSFSGPNVSRFLQDQIFLGPKNESLTQADLYFVASSLFRIGVRLPSNTILSCSFSRGVLTVFVFVLHPDSLMMSGARVSCLVQCPSTVQFDQSQL